MLLLSGQHPAAFYRVTRTRASVSIGPITSRTLTGASETSQSRCVSVIKENLAKCRSWSSALTAMVNQQKHCFDSLHHLMTSPCGGSGGIGKQNDIILSPSRHLEKQPICQARLTNLASKFLWKQICRKTNPPIMSSKALFPFEIRFTIHEIRA